MGSTATILYPDVHNWRDLYRAALFETDTAKLASRIASAEQAIVTRGRQLFGAEIKDSEDQALDDALYALRALKSCLRLSPLGA
jgi:hypothetical protein